MFKFILKKAFSTANEPQIIRSILQGDQKGIIVLELNNPTKRNALSKQLMIDLADSISFISKSLEIRCAILKSRIPGIFCAGADLKERSTLANNEVEDVVENLRMTFDAFYRLPIPTIASIDGPALGGGLELALSADIRIASKSAILGLTETSLGLLPGAGGTQKLPRLIGLAAAKELIFTARRLTSEEALAYGIVNYVEENREKNEAKAIELATKICKNGPIAVRMAKEAINYGIETDLRTGLQIEKLCYKKIIATQDRVEGMKAFLEKRPPKYEGN